jgi:hypothetical protein
VQNLSNNIKNLQTKERQMIESSNLKELPPALCTLQAKLENPSKDTKAYNYKYAQIDQILAITKPILKDNGFSLVQFPYNDGEILGVETMLMHESGEWIKGRFGSKLTKQDAQTVGSQITYYRRYSLMSVLNIAQEDDDGKATVSTKSELATDGQKKFLFSLLGQEKYNQNKVFIENEMTKAQAREKIEELNKGRK